MAFLRIWSVHVLAGVPAAALTHSLVQLAYAWESASDATWLPLHFLLGFLFGLPILVPAYTLQAWLFALLARVRSPGWVQVLAGASLQAGLVGLWNAFIGVEPSLAGNFPMLPVMLGAAASVGGLVAGLAGRILRRA